MTEKIIGVYKITNTITGDFYIGSSKDIKHRWANHKCLSKWKEHPNNQMYQDMQKYGIEKFDFQILEEAEIEHLKEAEQQFIEKMHPIYNSNRAKGLDIERLKESNRKANRKYQKSAKYKKTHRKANNKYRNKSCLYNSEVLTLDALYKRFRRSGIENPILEAKKYILNNSKVK